MRRHLVSAHKTHKPLAYSLPRRRWAVNVRIREINKLLGFRLDTRRIQSMLIREAEASVRCVEFLDEIDEDAILSLAVVKIQSYWRRHAAFKRYDRLRLQLLQTPPNPNMEHPSCLLSRSGHEANEDEYIGACNYCGGPTPYCRHCGDVFCVWCSSFAEAS